MSKILIFKKSNLYSNNYNNVINFANEVERDNYINTYLSESGNYQEELNNRPEQAMLLNGIINNEIEVGANFSEYKNSNYCVILDSNNKLSFHFITEINNNYNNNKLTLTLQYDLVMNNLNFFSSLTNFKLSKGHSDLTNYLDKEFTDIYFKDVGFREIQKNNTGGQSVFNQTPFLYVLRKTSDSSNLIKQKNNRSYNEAFKVYVAPLKDVYISDGEAPVLFDGMYKLKLNDNTGDFTPKEIPFNQEILVEDNYKFNYGAVTTGTDKDNLFYNLSGNLFPLIGESKIIFLGNDDWSTKIANQLNNGDFSEKYFIPINNENWNIVYPIKITNINNINYVFEIPTGNDLYNLDNSTWYYFENNITMVPNNNDLFGVADNLDSQIILKQLVDLSGATVWNSISLMNFINTTDDGTIITAKVSNFNPLIINTQNTTISFSDIINISKEDNNYVLNYVNYDNDNNNYKIYFQSLEEVTKLRGLLPFKLMIENNLEIDLNNLFFKQEIINGITLDVLEFKHYASITPEWEERIKYQKEGLIDITNDANSWTNDKEFTIASNVWDNYKAANPVTSRLGLRALGGVGKIFGGGITASLFGGAIRRKTTYSEWSDKTNKQARSDYKNLTGKQIIENKIPLPDTSRSNFRKQNPRQAGNVLKGITLGTGAEISNILEKTNTRHMLDTTQGTGDVLGDLIFNYSNGFMLVNMEPVGVGYKSQIRDIRRFGLEYDREFYINNINDIKRENFNFIQSNNIFENIKLNLYNFSIEELEAWIELFNKGIRIWWNAANFLNYEVRND